MTKHSDATSSTRPRKLTLLLVVLSLLALTWASLQWLQSRDPRAAVRYLSDAELADAIRAHDASEIAVLELSNRLRERQRIPEAIEALEQTIKRGHGSARIHRELGICYSQLQLNEKALEHLESSTALSPGDYEAYLYLGAVQQANRQYSAAILSFQRAASLNPGLAEVFLRLGSAHESEGNLREAIVAYERAVAVNADDATAHYQLGRAYHQQKRLDEAQRELQRAVKLAPARADYLVAQGFALLDLPTDDAPRHAARCFDRVLAIDARNGPAHYGRGVVWKRQERWSEAAAEFEAALSTESENQELRFDLAQVYKRLGRHEDSKIQMQQFQELRVRAERKQRLGYLRREARLHPDRAAAHYNLGVFYEEEERDTRQALESYRRALKLQPNYPRASTRLEQLEAKRKIGTRP